MSMPKGSGGVGEDAQFARNLFAQEAYAWENFYRRRTWSTLRAWREARQKLQRSIQRQGALYS